MHAADVTRVPFENWYSVVERLIFVMVLMLIVKISRESTGGKIVYKRTASYTSYPQTSDMTDKLNSDRTTGKHNQVDIEWMLY